MFAKIARIQIASLRRRAPGSVVLAHSNDNTTIAHAGVGPHGSGRPTLVCHWRPMIGGGLECHWDAELAMDEAIEATEEADQCWIGIYALSGAPLAA